MSAIFQTGKVPNGGYNENSIIADREGVLIPLSKLDKRANKHARKRCIQMTGDIISLSFSKKLSYDCNPE